MGTGTKVISAVGDADVSPAASTNAPDVPLATPGLWALMAFARRDPEQAITAAQAKSNPAITQTTSELIGHTPETTSRSAPELAAQTQNVQPGDPSAGDQSLYTGRPSLVTQVVVLGLRIVDVVLKPFGGLLAFTGLGLPIFTDGVPPRSSSLTGSSSARPIQR